MNVAVVGASSGLGAALALHHAASGDSVVAVARRVDRLAQLAAHAGRSAMWHSLSADISSPSGLASTIDAVRGAARIYLCAAINGGAEKTFAVNVIAPLAIATDVDEPGTQIVLVSSLASVVAFPDLELYCASKAALEHAVACRRSTSAADLLVLRPGQFPSEFHTGPQPLDTARLPHRRAAQAAAAADRVRAGTVTLGGFRDVLAARLARILGPTRTRAVL